jgi:hypothetical protein
MAYVWQVFEETGTANVPRRDDLMLLNIAERLPALMEGPISNPAEPSELLGASWSDEERRTAIEHANEMLQNMRSIVNRCYLPEDAVDQMRAIFGARIPNRPDLVGVEQAAKAEVRSHERIYTPAPLVGRSVSG